MDKEIFVKNVKKYCVAKGVKPTVACRESGVGTSFLTDIKRGQTPSVGRVQLLAQYLDCTVSPGGQRLKRRIRANLSGSNAGESKQDHF